MRKVSIFMAVLLFSCAPQLPVTENPDIVTIEFEQAGNSYRFYTNNPSNRGRSFGKTFDETADNITVSCNKKTGSVTANYGLLFAVQDNENYFFVLLNTSGNYFIWQLKNNQWLTVADNQASTNLKTRYNVNNTLNVKIAGGTAAITINGTLETTVSDPAITGDKWGLYVDIAENEDFPGVPVEVIFTKE